MNGAEILLNTAVKAGVEICFTNPGTTELPLVAAIDAVPGIRPASPRRRRQAARCRAGSGSGVAC